VILLVAVLGGRHEGPSALRQAQGPSATRRSGRVFHFWDSLPREALHRMEEALRAEPEAGRNLKRQHRFHQLLDQGFGSCILREKFAAEIVENAIRYWDNQRYLLYAWVIMPNHVHILVKPLGNWRLGRLIQSWKRHTSREIRKKVGNGAPSCTRLGGIAGSVALGKCTVCCWRNSSF